MDNDSVTYVLHLPLGTFGMVDPADPEAWEPNPRVPMTPQQQFNYNVDNGFLRLNTPAEGAH